MTEPFTQPVTMMMIWNQSFEMQEPTVSICQKYVDDLLTVMEKKSMSWMTAAHKGKFKVTMPVIKIGCLCTWHGGSFDGR